jgi:hypothetical protein
MERGPRLLQQLMMLAQRKVKKAVLFVDFSVVVVVRVLVLFLIALALALISLFLDPFGGGGVLCVHNFMFNLYVLIATRLP